MKKKKVTYRKKPSKKYYSFEGGGFLSDIAIPGLDLLSNVSNLKNASHKTKGTAVGSTVGSGVDAIAQMFGIPTFGLGEKLGSFIGSEFNPEPIQKYVPSRNTSGNWVSYQKGGMKEKPIQLPLVTVTEDAPQWLGYRREYDKKNPFNIDEYVERRFNQPFGRKEKIAKINPEEFKENLRNEGIINHGKASNTYVAKRLLRDRPQGSMNRQEWLSLFTPKELEIITNSNLSNKIKPSAWSKFEQGLLSIGNAGSPVQLKNENLSQQEARQENNPLNILTPLGIPAKMVQAPFRTGYSVSDAVRGESNDATLAEDLLADPLNYVGMGLVASLSKANKLRNATNIGKILNKTDDLSNIRKLESFNNPDEFYRVIAGNEAFNDIVTSNVVRTKPNLQKQTEGIISLGNRPTAFPSFTKGKASVEYANSNPNNYIIVSSDPSIKPSTIGRHGKGTTMFPTDNAGKQLSELSGEKVSVYKHAGDGNYQLVYNKGKKVDNIGDLNALNISADLTQAKPWQLQELPGLHLQSTMENGAIRNIVEPKTGLVNVEQALGIIGKESGGANKVAIIKQGLGENIPKKMDYNQFRKIVQDQLIPLEREIATHRSDYGLRDLGFSRLIDEKKPNFLERFQEFMNRPINNLNPGRLIENQTLILGNKSKLGAGSVDHGNPSHTLGHVHFFRDSKTPDTFTVSQIQSDVFQNAKKQKIKTIEKAQEDLDILKRDWEEDRKLFSGDSKADISVRDKFEEAIMFKQAEVDNFTQRQLLDKNHQERYLQEIVDYAGKRGNLNKVRLPTPETAANIQGYRQIDYSNVYKEIKDLQSGRIDDINKLSPETKSVLMNEGKMVLIDSNWNLRNREEFLNDLNSRKGFFEFLEKNKLSNYTNTEATVLKKYAEQPENIKKLYGVEPKIVKDDKGNTWYEFDIPEKFKQGKGEIKAFGALPAAPLMFNQSKNNNQKEFGGNLQTFQKGGFLGAKALSSKKGKFADPYEVYLTPEHAAYLSDLNTQYNFPEGLLEGVTLTESGGGGKQFGKLVYKPRAGVKSNAGAKGYFQFTDATAKDYGLLDNELDLRDDFQESAQAAAKMLNDNINRFGSTDKALMAYNWGPANLEKYINKKEKGKNPNMPRETKKYIDKVNYYSSVAAGNPWSIHPDSIPKVTPDKFVYPNNQRSANSNLILNPRYFQAGGNISNEPIVNLPEINVTEKAPQWLVDKKTKDPKKIKFYNTLNFKKWGLNDYSNYDSFNSAFRNSRNAGEKEFVFKKKRYTTDLIPKKDSDLYFESKNFLNDYYKNNYKYKPTFSDTLAVDGSVGDILKEKEGDNWSTYYNKVKGNIDKMPVDEAFNHYKRLEYLMEAEENLKNKLYAELPNKGKEDYIKNLNDPSYYFSITSQKPKNLASDGYTVRVNPKFEKTDGHRKKVFLTTNPEKDKLNTAFVHELAHKSQPFSEVYAPEVNIALLNEKGTDMSQGTFDYLKKPEEIEARKMSTLFYLKKNNIDINSIKNVTDLQNLYNTHESKLPYDIKQLFNLYNHQGETLLKYLKNQYQEGGNVNNKVEAEIEGNEYIFNPNKIDSTTFKMIDNSGKKHISPYGFLAKGNKHDNTANSGIKVMEGEAYIASQHLGLNGKKSNKNNPSVASLMLKNGGKALGNGKVTDKFSVNDKYTPNAVKHHLDLMQQVKSTAEKGKLKQYLKNPSSIVMPGSF